MCLTCNGPIPAKLENIRGHFLGKRLTCNECHNEHDAWETYRSAIEVNFMGNAVYSVIGAHAIFFKERLKRDKPLQIKFERYGIPPGSRILQIIYTPNGPLFGMEAHGNMSTTRRYYDDGVTLWPAPFTDSAPDEVDLSVVVTWIYEDANTESVISLVDACEAFAHEKYTDTIIPANIVVEVETSRLLSDVLSHTSSTKRVDEFLSNEATYGAQLDILIPFIATTYDKPRLPDPIAGHLRRLRKLRNQLAHQGKLVKELDKRGTSELICAALFGFVYVSWLRSELTAEREQ